MDEYIKILELPDSFDLDDLKKAYRKMSKKYHPDFAKSPEERAYFTEKMKEINNANEILKEYLKTHGRYTKTRKTNSSSNSNSENSNTHSSQEQTNQETKHTNYQSQTNYKEEQRTEESTIFNFSEEKTNMEKNIYRAVAVILFLILIFGHKTPENNKVAEKTPEVQEVVYDEPTEKEKPAIAEETQEEPIEVQTVENVEIPFDIISEVDFPEIEPPAQEIVYSHAMPAKASTAPKLSQEDFTYQEIPTEA